MAGKTVKLPETRPLDAIERSYVREMVRGLKVTSSKWLRNITTPHDTNPENLERVGQSEVQTLEYPDEQKPIPRNYRAMHRLTYREDGRPRCVACFMCSTACPAHCIYIEAGEYADDPIEKFPIKFEIDELKCIVCGLCVEACPKDAIRMDTGRHANAVLDRSAALYTREQLVDESKPFGATIPEGGDPEISREHLRYLQTRGEREQGEEGESVRVGPDPRR